MHQHDESRAHHNHPHVSRAQALGVITALGASAMLAGSGASAADAPRWVDVHFHHYPKPLVDAMQAWQDRNHLPAIGPMFRNWTVASALDEMNANGVATAFLSLASPHGVWFDVPSAQVPALSRTCNEFAADAVRQHPTRFGFFASLPMPDIDASLKEIAYALDTLGADGIGLPTSFGDVWPGDAKFAPVWQELNRRKAVVVFHPYAPNCCGTLPTQIPESFLEYPYDTGRAILNLLITGTFRAYPDIRWVFSHGGGVIPMLAGRIQTLGTLAKNIKTYAPDGVDAVFTSLYYDTANVGYPASLAAVTTYLPTSQLLFGTDFPYVSDKQNIDGLLAAHFPPATLAAIARGNATRLFPKLARL
jgi:predicted TIM-barrel fold metal-dependent hydrolase